MFLGLEVLANKMGKYVEQSDKDTVHECLLEQFSFPLFQDELEKGFQNRRNLNQSNNHIVKKTIAIVLQSS